MDNKRLLIIGGAEDKTQRGKILLELLNLSKEREGPIVIVAAATEDPEGKRLIYYNTFKSMGFDNLDVINIKDRIEAFGKNTADRILKARAVFLTGGDQLRITSKMGGTAAYQAIRKCYDDGVLIAGTSAGASCLCSTMLVSGEDDTPPIKCTVKMAPGLNLIQSVIIDQHFSQRGRIGRLLNAVSQNPGIIGIGIDEDTAIYMKNEENFFVLGKSSVTVADGKEISFTNVSEVKPDSVLAISNVRLHILPDGYGFDLIERKPIIKGASEVNYHEDNR